MINTAWKIKSVLLLVSCWVKFKSACEALRVGVEAYRMESSIIVVILLPQYHSDSSLVHPCERDDQLL